MQTKSKEDGGKDARVHNFYIRITQENYELWQQCSCHQCCFQKRVQKKKQEEFVITSSNTVDHPNTVVVHLQYTSLTDRTVMAPWGFEVGTFTTVSD
jgi:hypothetical protein